MLRPGLLDPALLPRSQGLWNFDPDATNLGIVNVLMDQCAIMLWPSLKVGLRVSTSWAGGVLSSVSCHRLRHTLPCSLIGGSRPATSTEVRRRAWGWSARR